MEGFRAFAAQMDRAIATADVKFFLDNVTFEDLDCDDAHVAPDSCFRLENDPLKGVVRVRIESVDTVPGIGLGVWTSEGFGLDAAGYEEFIRESLTEFDAGASDAYGDAKPQLYAYAILRPEFQSPSTTLETIQAITTRIVPGPAPRFPPPGRGVLIVHTSFDGQRWTITRLTVTPSPFLYPPTAALLDPTTPEAIDILQYWERWEGSTP